MNSFIENVNYVAGLDNLYGSRVEIYKNNLSLRTELHDIVFTLEYYNFSDKKLHTLEYLYSDISIDNFNSTLLNLKSQVELTGLFDCVVLFSYTNFVINNVANIDIKITSNSDNIKTYGFNLNITKDLTEIYNINGIVSDTLKILPVVASLDSSFIDAVTTIQENIDVIKNAEANAIIASEKAVEALSSSNIAIENATISINNASVAILSANNSEISAELALTSATTATQQADIATVKSTEASASASSALISKNESATNSSNSLVNANNASISEVNALASQESATLSEQSALQSKLDANASATSASNSEAISTQNAIDAAESASLALSSASDAEFGASMAETAATNALASATSAMTHATTATTKASEASVSASEALSYKDIAVSAANSITNMQVATGLPNSAVTWDGTTLTVPKGIGGIDGIDGTSIVSVIRTSGTGTAGTTDTYTITYTDNSTSTFTVYNGADGTGSGDMNKSIYDINNSGVVDNAEKVNGLTVQTAVPTGAVFTDTVYDDTGVLKDTDIDISIQRYDVNTVIDSMYVHTDNNFTNTLKSKLDSLSNYTKPTSEPIPYISGLDSALNSKVDKVAGKGLSTEDYTTTEKTKLADIADNANNYILPVATSTVKGGVNLYSDVVQTVASNAVSTTANRTYGLQLNSAGQVVVNVPWTDTGTVYTHPTADGYLHVPATSTTNNGKVLMAGATAGSVSWQTIPSGVTDHTLLTNIGTNTHAQIDTALTRLVNTSGTNTGDQTITLTGDVTGSGTGSFSTALKNTGTAGTYKSVTTDSQGRVTSGTNPTTIAGFGITDVYTKTEVDIMYGDIASALDTINGEVV